MEYLTGEGLGGRSDLMDAVQKGSIKSAAQVFLWTPCKMWRGS
jgi:hypothetical protein